MPLYRTVSDRGLWKKYQRDSVQHFHKPHYVKDKSKPQVTYSQLDLGEGYRYNARQSNPNIRADIDEVNARFNRAYDSSGSETFGYRRNRAKSAPVTPTRSRSRNRLYPPPGYDPYDDPYQPPRPSEVVHRPRTSTSQYSQDTYGYPDSESVFSFESRELSSYQGGRDSAMDFNNGYRYPYDKEPPQPPVRSGGYYEPSYQRYQPYQRENPFRDMSKGEVDGVVSKFFERSVYTSAAPPPADRYADSTITTTSMYSSPERQPGRIEDLDSPTSPYSTMDSSPPDASSSPKQFVRGSTAHSTRERIKNLKQEFLSKPPEEFKAPAVKPKNKWLKSENRWTDPKAKTIPIQNGNGMESQPPNQNGLPSNGALATSTPLEPTVKKFSVPQMHHAELVTLRADTSSSSSEDEGDPPRNMVIQSPMQPMPKEVTQQLYAQPHKINPKPQQQPESYSQQPYAQQVASSLGRPVPPPQTALQQPTHYDPYVLSTLSSHNEVGRDPNQSLESQTMVRPQEPFTLNESSHSFNNSSAFTYNTRDPYEYQEVRQQQYPNGQPQQQYPNEQHQQFLNGQQQQHPDEQQQQYYPDQHRHYSTEQPPFPNPTEPQPLLREPVEIENPFSNFERRPSDKSSDRRSGRSDPDGEGRTFNDQAYDNYRKMSGKGVGKKKPGFFSSLFKGKKSKKKKGRKYEDDEEEYRYEDEELASPDEDVTQQPKLFEQIPGLRSDDPAYTGFSGGDASAEVAHMKPIVPQPGSGGAGSSHYDPQPLGLPESDHNTYKSTVTSHSFDYEDTESAPLQRRPSRPTNLDDLIKLQEEELKEVETANNKLRKVSSRPTDLDAVLAEREVLDESLDQVGELIPSANSPLYRHHQSLNTSFPSSDTTQVIDVDEIIAASEHEVSLEVDHGQVSTLSSEPPPEPQYANQEIINRSLDLQDQSFVDRSLDQQDQSFDSMANFREQSEPKQKPKFFSFGNTKKRRPVRPDVPPPDVPMSIEDLDNGGFERPREEYQEDPVPRTPTPPPERTSSPRERSSSPRPRSKSPRSSRSVSPVDQRRRKPQKSGFGNFFKSPLRKSGGKKQRPKSMGHLHNPVDVSHLAVDDYEEELKPQIESDVVVDDTPAEEIKPEISPSDNQSEIPSEIPRSDLSEMQDQSEISTSSPGYRETDTSPEYHKPSIFKSKFKFPSAKSNKAQKEPKPPKEELKPKKEEPKPFRPKTKTPPRKIKTPPPSGGMDIMNYFNVPAPVQQYPADEHPTTETEDEVFEIRYEEQEPPPREQLPREQPPMTQPTREKPKWEEPPREQPSIDLSLTEQLPKEQPQREELPREEPPREDTVTEQPRKEQQSETSSDQGEFVLDEPEEEIPPRGRKPRKKSATSFKDFFTPKVPQQFKKDEEERRGSIGSRNSQRSRSLPRHRKESAGFGGLFGSMRSSRSQEKLRPRPKPDEEERVPPQEEPPSVEAPLSTSRTSMDEELPPQRQSRRPPQKKTSLSNLFGVQPAKNRRPPTGKRPPKPETEDLPPPARGPPPKSKSTSNLPRNTKGFGSLFSAPPRLPSKRADPRAVRDSPPPARSHTPSKESLDNRPPLPLPDAPTSPITPTVYDQVKPEPTPQELATPRPPSATPSMTSSSITPGRQMGRRSGRFRKQTPDQFRQTNPGYNVSPTSQPPSLSPAVEQPGPSEQDYIQDMFVANTARRPTGPMRRSPEMDGEQVQQLDALPSAAEYDIIIDKAYTEEKRKGRSETNLGRSDSYRKARGGYEEPVRPSPRRGYSHSSLPRIGKRHDRPNGRDSVQTRSTEDVRSLDRRRPPQRRNEQDPCSIM